MTDATTSKQRPVPDREKCRTRNVGGYLAFTYCLLETPNCCEHAARFGDDILCRHPDRQSFEKTDPPALMPLR